MLAWHDPKPERALQQPHLGEDPENKFCWVVYPKDWSVRYAVLTYNNGVLSRVRVLEKLCGSSGPNCTVGLKYADRSRVYYAEKKEQELEKRAAQARKIKKKASGK